MANIINDPARGISYDQDGNIYKFGTNELVSGPAMDRPFRDKKKESEDIWKSQSFQDFLKNQKLKSPFDLNSSNPKERELARDWYEARQEEFIDGGGQPMRPEFVSMIDPKTGKLNESLLAKTFGIDPKAIGQINFQSVLDPMQERLDQIQLNKEGLNALRDEGLRTGPSAWANLMSQKIKDDEMAGLEKVAGQAQGSNAAALNNLAMSGGLRSGARTSLAKAMQRDVNAGSQGVRRGASQDALNLAIQDETKRMGVLSQLPGMELQAISPEMEKANFMNQAQLTEQARGLDTQKANADINFNTQKYNSDIARQADQFNIQAALNEKLSERAFDSNVYNELMKSWAAGKTADAQSGGGKK